jgi:7-cyano-7-deazaguanine synthase in queuosine biosynthesis
MLLAASWCIDNGITALATGHQNKPNNPDSISVNLVQPLVNLSNAQIISLVKDLPLGFTFSCKVPVESQKDQWVHCGTCHHCQERQIAFTNCGTADKTIYASAGQPTHTRVASL